MSACQSARPTVAMAAATSGSTGPRAAQQPRVDAEHRHLGVGGVDDGSTAHHRAGSRYLGQRGQDQAPGERLGDRQGQTSLAQCPHHACGARTISPQCSTRLSHAGPVAAASQLFLGAGQPRAARSRHRSPAVTTTAAAHDPLGDGERLTAPAGSRYKVIARICSAVLSLPPRLAAITPCRITQNRSSGHTDLAAR